MLRLPIVVTWLLATATVVLVTLVVAAKDVAVTIIFLTCGLGIPLLLTPTFAAYLVCFAPAALAAALSAGRPAWWFGASMSLAALLAMALLPPALSKSEAAAEIARAAGGDTIAPLGALARTLEIVRPSSEEANLDAPVFGGDICGAECRALLLGGEVDWVRVVSLSWSPGRITMKEDSRVRLVRAVGAGCAAPDDPATSDATCVIFVSDVAEPAALVLRFEDGDRDRDGPYPEAGWARPAGWRRVTAMLAGAAAPALRRTEVHVRVVHVPTVLFVRTNWMSSSGGVEMSRSTRKHGEVTLAGALRDLGYPLAHLDAELSRATKQDHAKPGPPDEEATRRLVSILDLPGDAPFAPSQQSAVSGWLVRARAWTLDGGWSPQRVELVRRIATDARIQDPWMLDDLVASTPALAVAVLPDVIARTEALGLPRDAPWLQAWRGFMRAEPKLLYPYADRIASLVDAYPAPLVRLSGRLGVDPTGWLVPLARGDVRDDKGLEGRLSGACRAEALWSAQLVGPLRLFLEQLDIDDDSGAYLAEAAVRALVRHGDIDGARERLQGRGEDAARAWRRLDGDLRRTGVTDAICR